MRGLLISVIVGLGAAGVVAAKVLSSRQAPSPPLQVAEGKPTPRPQAGARARVSLEEDHDEYIEQFRLCVAGVQEACERTGHGKGKRQGAGREARRREVAVLGAEEARRARYRDAAGAKRAEEEVHLDPAQLSIVFGIAANEQACRQGQKPACSALTPEDLRLLKDMEGKLQKGCEGRAADLCLARGEVAAVRGQKRVALEWLGKGEAQARRVRARCSAKTRPPPPECSAAQETLERARARKVEIEAELRRGP